jgi:hypothetical protein
MNNLFMSKIHTTRLEDKALEGWSGLIWLAV